MSTSSSATQNTESSANAAPLLGALSSIQNMSAALAGPQACCSTTVTAPATGWPHTLDCQAFRRTTSWWTAWRVA